jgi:hypothetical protein
MKQDHDEPNPADGQSQTEPAAAPNLPETLDDLAREINAVLKNEDEIVERFDNEFKKVRKELELQLQSRGEEIASRKAVATKDLRIEAGRLLIEAKKKVAPGGWQHWLNKNIRRRFGDCCRCMKMAGADDPEKEREKEKANIRARVQKHRDAKRAGKGGAQRLLRALHPPL